jgi:hypothetical protein
MNISIPAQGLFNTPPANWAYIGLIPALAALSGLAVYLNPGWFYLVLTLDLWLLGYHHVIATYTRIAFDMTSIKEHWLLLFPLPLAVISAVALGYHFAGGILISSVYLYWQWYHYTRQSEGISKAYGMKYGDKKIAANFFNRTAFYGIAALSFVWMITRQDSDFLGMPFWSFHLPEPVRLGLLSITLLLTASWLIYLATLLKHKKISKFYFSYMVSHAAIYLFSYIVIEPISFGWLVINIWHNSQYIFFVWLSNSKKYSNGIDSQHKAISYLSQPNRIIIYLLACMLLTTIVYGGLQQITEYAMTNYNLSLILLLYSTINFHHYIIDSKIWKLKHPKIQSSLGLNKA